MKLPKTAFLILIIVLATTFISAQKPKPKPKATAKKTTVKAKPTPKITSKTDDSDDLFNFEITEKELEKISKTIDAIDRKRAEEFYQKGLAYWKNFDISEAIDSYSKAIEIYPDYIEALRERGRIYSMIGKGQEAIPDLTAYLKTQPNSVEFLNMRGLSYSEITENLIDSDADKKLIDEIGTKALTDFNKAVELDPKNPSFYNNRSKLFIDFLMYKEAIADLEKAIAIDGKYALAYSNLGLAKSYQNAISGSAELKRAIELEPKSAAVYYNRGVFNTNIYAFDEAIADFTKAIELHGTKPKYYNTRGMLYFAKGNGDAALQDFSTAIAQETTLGLNVFIGRAHLNRALTYKKFPETAADSKTDRVIEGMALQYQKMLTDLNQAIKYNPNLAEAYIERGLMRSTSTGINLDGLDAKTINQLNLALADFEKAIQLDPKSAQAYNGRASCYDELGKNNLALADYNKAIELDPEMVTPYMGRMGIYCETGKKELSIIDEKKIKALGYAAINVCNLSK